MLESGESDNFQRPRPIQVDLKLSKAYGEVKDVVRTCTEPLYAWRLTSERTDKGQMHFTSNFQDPVDRRLTKYVTLDVSIGPGSERKIAVSLKYAVYCESLSIADCYFLISRTTKAIRERLVNVEDIINNRDLKH
jgi:hypothetical protein